MPLTTKTRQRMIGLAASFLMILATTTRAVAASLLWSTGESDFRAISATRCTLLVRVSNPGDLVSEWRLAYVNEGRLSLVRESIAAASCATVESIRPHRGLFADIDTVLFARSSAGTPTD